MRYWFDTEFIEDGKYPIGIYEPIKYINPSLGQSQIAGAKKWGTPRPGRCPLE
jgi:hypothetical protein